MSLFAYVSQNFFLCKHCLKWCPGQGVAKCTVLGHFERGLSRYGDSPSAGKVTNNVVDNST
jgi:hypothetical protein